MTVHPSVLPDQFALEDFRQLLVSIMGGTLGLFAGGVTATDAAHGVARTDDLKVTASGSPDLNVHVAAGAALIRGTEDRDQGAYPFYNDATVDLAVAAGDGTNARWDLVVAEVPDSAYSGALDTPRVRVVQGTPAGSPADPPMPANSLALARIVMPANADNVGGGAGKGTITDLRPPLPRPGKVKEVSTTSQQGGWTTEADLTSLTTGSIVLYPGRNYEARISIPIYSTVAGDSLSLRIYKGASIIKDVFFCAAAANGQETVEGFAPFTVSSTSPVTVKVTGRRAAGTGTPGTLPGSGNPAILSIWDCGPT